MHICTDGCASKPRDNVKGKSIPHRIYITGTSISDRGIVPTINGGRRHTDIEVRDELGQRLPREVHRAQALPDKREPRPRAILDEPPRLEENKVQRLRRERDVKSGLRRADVCPKVAK